MFIRSILTMTMALSFGLISTGCSKKASDKDCKDASANVLKVYESGGDSAEAAVKGHESFMKSCTSLTPEQVECSGKAGSLSDLKACTGDKKKQDKKQS